MFAIRSEHLKAFSHAALVAFEDEIVLRCLEFSPRLCELLGEEQLRVAIRQAMGRANGYGFTNRGPLRLYVELMFLCGSDFDTDPQYAKVGAVLRASGDQMVRAQRIHEGSLDYHEHVAGPGNSNVHKALEALAVFAEKPLLYSASQLEAGMLHELARIFPQRAAYVGEQGLRALIADGRAKAKEYGLPTIRGEALLVALMFAFGHGCTNDPLYPWISRTLKDEKIVDGAAREKRLERKAVTWLEHVVASNRKEAQT